MTRALVLTIAALISFQFTAQSQNITIDSSFGTAGVAAFDLGYTFPQVKASVVQLDGKILALAELQNNTGSPAADIGLCRYLNNGALDVDFGDNGILTTSWGLNSRPADLLALPDGKILVAGFSMNELVIARYHPNGDVDLSFGTDGQARFPSSNHTARLHLTTDGKIAVATFCLDWTACALRLARLLPDGAPDETYGNAGFIDLNQYDISYIHDVTWTDSDQVVIAGPYYWHRFDQDGQFENSFAFPALDIVFYEIEIQPDGKVVALGQNSSRLVALARMHPDGSLDESFGDGGIVQDGWELPYFITNNIRGMLVLPNGKIAISGLLDPDAYTYLLQLNPDGSIDNTFGDWGGTVVLHETKPGHLAGVLLTHNSSLIAIGVKVYGLALNKYSSDGQSDATFGIAGKVFTPIRAPFSNDWILATAVQPDGKILLAAQAYYQYYVDNFGVIQLVTISRQVIMRTFADGSLDTAFGEGGIFSVAELPFTIGQLAIQPDGKIIAIGGNTALEYTGLLRLDSTGQVDETFAQNGLLRQFGLRVINYYQCIAFQADGKILLAGTTSELSTPAFLLARFDANGLPDTSFGVNSRIYEYFGNTTYAQISAMLIQPDGKILVAGYHDNSGPKLVLARYLPGNGSPDNTFGSNGKATYSATSPNGNGLFVRWLALQPDGKIAASGGRFEPIVIVSRFNANGSPDDTFGDGGILITPIEAYDVLDFKPAENGKLAIATYRYNSGNQNYTLSFALINANGSMDSTFGDNGVETIVSNSPPTRANLRADGSILLSYIINGDAALVKYASPISVGTIKTPAILSQLLVYPNPVNDTSVIEFELREAETLSVEMYDMAGKKVGILASRQRFDAGSHQIALRMGQLPRSSYVLVLNSGKWHTAERIVY